jgi:hypothetical protein
MEEVWGTVKEVWDEANSDDCLSGGAKDNAAEPAAVPDAHEDIGEVNLSSTPLFPPTTVVLRLSSLSNPSPTSSSLL